MNKEFLELKEEIKRLKEENNSLKSHLNDVRESSELVKSTTSKIELSEIFNALKDEVHIWKVVRNEKGEIVDWKLAEVNETALIAWDKRRIDVIGKSPNEIFDFDAITQFKPTIDQIFKSNKSSSWTQYFEPTDQHLMMDSIPLGDYFISTGKDITDRVKMEQSLLESEARFRMLFHKSMAANLVADDNGNYLDVNQAAIDLFGYSKSQFLNMNVKDLKVQESRPFEEKYSEFVDKGIESGELTIINGKNETKTIFYKAIRFKENFNLSVAFDITDRKKTEQDLKNTLTEIELAQKIAKLGYWEYNPKEEELIWSKEIFELFELDPNQGTPSVKKHEQLLEKGSFYLLTDSLEKAAKNGIAYNIELALKNHKKWIRSICITKKLVNQEGYLLKGVLQDITEQKMIEKELQISNATKDKFFSIIAHDLKNPLSNITSITELIHKELDTISKKEVQGIFEDLYGSSKNAQLLLDNLLDWARSEQGEITFKPKSVMLNTIIQEVFDLLNPLANERQVSLKSNVADNFKVHADPNMLATILRNLVSNSIKFSNQNGQVQLTATQTANVDSIAVEDNGIGMNKQELNDLFKPSNYSYASGSDRKGTGIGLQLCKDFVVKQGGTIEAESEEGKGSKFTFTLKSKPTKNR